MSLQNEKNKRNFNRSTSSTKAKTLDSLYADHEIFEDIVIGPVEIRKPVLTLKFTGTSLTQATRSYSVSSKTEPRTKQKESVKDTKPEKKKLYSCKMCKSKNLEHYNCDLCGEMYISKNAIISHFKKHTRPSIVCDICKKEFRYPRSLEIHMTRPCKVKSFACNVCDKKYSSKSSLHAHLTSIHDKKTMYHCKHCPKSFHVKGQLQVHTRQHTGEKPYKCEICTKRFTQQTSLNNHLLRHKGIKPYCCKHCHERFRQVANLKQHIIVKHSNKKTEDTDKSDKDMKSMKNQNAKKQLTNEIYSFIDRAKEAFVLKF